MHMVTVTFLQDYQGKDTGPHFYRAGQTADVELAAVPGLVERGVVSVVEPVEEKPAPARSKRKRG